MKVNLLRSLTLRRPVRVIISLVVVVIGAVALGSLGLNRYQADRQAAAQTVARAGHELGQAVLDGLNQAMMTNGRNNIQRILSVAKNYQGVMRVLVIGPNGHVYVSSGSPEANATVPTNTPGCVECHRLPADKLPKTTYLKFQPGQVRAATPIGVTTGCNSCHVSTTGSKLGVVLVDMSLSAGEGRSQNDLIVWLIGSALGAIVMGAGLYWLLGSRARPVLRLPDWRSKRLRATTPASAARFNGRRLRASKWARLGMIGGAIGLVILIGGGVFAAQVESTHAGCTTCHTQPETTYVDRAQAAPIDLASAHAAEKVACIDCHSGNGVIGRVEAIWLGARNTVAYVSGHYHSPAVMRYPLNDASCIKCHAAVPSDAHSANHYHFYLAQWQRSDPAKAGTCATCHTAHRTGNPADQHYANQATLDSVCQRCHAQARISAAWP